MPASIFSETELARLASFPEEIPGDDLIRAFTRAGADRDLVAIRRRAANRLGLALQLLCTSLPRLRSAQFERSSAIGRLLCRGPARRSARTRFNPTLDASRRADSTSPRFGNPSASRCSGHGTWKNSKLGLSNGPLSTRLRRFSFASLVSGCAQERTYTLVEPLLSAERRAQLDGLLEHTADTAGYTEIVFALFHLLGLQFAPRIRDLGAQRLYRLDAPPRKEGVAVLLKGLVRSKTLLDNWDELLRVARLTQVGLGDRIAPDFEAPDWRKRERLVPSPPRSRAPRQDPVHPKVD